MRVVCVAPILLIAFGCSDPPTDAETKPPDKKSEAPIAQRIKPPPQYKVALTQLYEIHAPNDEELRHAVAQVEFAVDRFEEGFGIRQPGTLIVIFNSFEEYQQAGIQSMMGTTSLQVFYTREGMRKLDPTSKNDNVNQIISHETGHKLLQQFAFQIDDEHLYKRRKVKEDRSGSGYMPDWLDECAGVLCENESFVAKRWKSLRLHIDDWIPLSKMFTMPHPDLDIGKAQSREAMGAPIVARVPKHLQRISDMFYAQCRAITEYLIEKGGKGCMRQFAVGLVEGASMDELLLESTNLPKSVIEFEKDLKTWVQNRMRR